MKVADYYRTKNQGIDFSKGSMAQQPDNREMPLDRIYSQVAAPEVDFSKETLIEQTPDQDAGGLAQQTSVKDTDFSKPTFTEQQGQGDVALKAASDGLMMFGDPSMKAVGLGLATANQIKAGQNQRKQQEYQAEVAKINARQNAINRLAEMGSRMKA